MKGRMKLYPFAYIMLFVKIFLSSAFILRLNFERNLYLPIELDQNDKFRDSQAIKKVHFKFRMQYFKQGIQKQSQINNYFDLHAQNQDKSPASTQRQYTILLDSTSSSMTQVDSLAMNSITFAASEAITLSTGIFLQVSYLRSAYSFPSSSSETFTRYLNSEDYSPVETFGYLISFSSSLTGRNISSGSLIPLMAIPQLRSLGIANSSDFPFPFMLLESQILPNGVLVYSLSNRSAQISQSSSLYYSRLLDFTPIARQI